MRRRVAAIAVAVCLVLMKGGTVDVSAAEAPGDRALTVRPDDRFRWELGPSEEELLYSGALTGKGMLTAAVESGGEVQARMAGTLDPAGSFSLTVDYPELGRAEVRFDGSELKATSSDLSPRDCSVIGQAAWTAVVSTLFRDLAAQQRLPSTDRAGTDWRIGALLAALDASAEAVKSVPGCHVSTKQAGRGER